MENYFLLFGKKLRLIRRINCLQFCLLCFVINGITSSQRIAMNYAL